MKGFFDSIAKARMQSTLLSMDRAWVESQGYSYTLLRAGVSEWPWREKPEHIAEVIETELTINQPAVSTEQKDVPDIDRLDIETAVGEAQAANDDELEQKKIVA